MTDILDLPGWTVLEKRIEGDEYEIHVEYTKHPDACQKCGVVGQVYRHGPKVVTYRDSPIRGRPVKLVAKVQRYQCRDCGGTFRYRVDVEVAARNLGGRFAIVPLYMSPQKREWKGLTDEEIDQAIGFVGSFGARQDARAIEAKLKEKNNG